MNKKTLEHSTALRGAKILLPLVAGRRILDPPPASYNSRSSPNVRQLGCLSNFLPPIHIHVKSRRRYASLDGIPWCFQSWRCLRQGDELPTVRSQRFVQAQIVATCATRHNKVTAGFHGRVEGKAGTIKGSGVTARRYTEASEVEMTKICRPRFRLHQFQSYYT